jgi:hypothetical protein
MKVSKLNVAVLVQFAGLLMLGFAHDNILRALGPWSSLWVASYIVVSRSASSRHSLPFPSPLLIRARIRMADA